MATKGIFKRGDIYWIRFAGADGATIKESTKSKKKADAEKLLIRRKNDILERRSPSKIVLPEMTFETFAEKYKAHCESQKGYSRKRLVISQLIEYFRCNNITDITLQMVEGYATYRRTIRKNKEGTVNRHISILKNMFTKMNDWEYISDEQLNKIRKVEIKKEEGERKRFLNKEQIEKFLAACKTTPHLYDIVLLALHTGCRRGEILSLKWEENIDLTHRILLLDVTKPGKGRELSMNNTLWTMLTRRKKEAGKNPYVFFHPRTKEKLNSVKHSFETARDVAGVPWFHFHDIRHTFASHLVMNNVDLATVKDFLGHQTMAMTMRYSHLSQNHKTQAINLLDTVYMPDKVEEAQIQPV